MNVHAATDLANALMCFEMATTFPESLNRSHAERQKEKETETETETVDSAASAHEEEVFRIVPSVDTLLHYAAFLRDMTRNAQGARNCFLKAVAAAKDNLVCAENAAAAGINNNNNHEEEEEEEEEEDRVGVCMHELANANFLCGQHYDQVRTFSTRTFPTICSRSSAVSGIRLY